MPVDAGASHTIDLTVAGDWQLVPGTTKPTSVASFYITDAPKGFRLDVRVGKGDGIPVTVLGFGVKAKDPSCDPMSGGIYYRVPVAGSGTAVLTWFAANVTIGRQ